MKNLTLYLATALLSTTTAASEGSHDVFGTFLTEDGDSHIKISDCGNGSPCGTVVWIDPASLAEGETPETITSKASGEPIMGMTMLWEFERSKKDWRKGKIYSPKADKTYSSRLMRLENGDLQVKGCIGFICQTQLWTSVTLPR